MMVDGEWYCYDKNGDAYENTFCTSNGKDYYVGDDGQLVAPRGLKMTEITISLTALVRRSQTTGD